MPAPDLRDHGARRAGFRHDLRLDVISPTTASGPNLQPVNNAPNHVAIRSLHDGTHIAGQHAYNKVGEKYRLRSNGCNPASWANLCWTDAEPRLERLTLRSSLSMASSLFNGEMPSRAES